MKPLKIIVAYFLFISTTTQAQIINTICGGYIGSDASATAIAIHPVNQVLDDNGNLYIAEYDRHIVRKLSKQGVFSIVAGNSISGYSGDGGQATEAELKNPFNIAIDKKGNLFIADSYDCRIRKVTTDGIITTVAGNGIPGYSGDGGMATLAKLNGPTAVAVDNNGNIYIADLSNRRIRKVDNNGIITTVAGNGTFGQTGDNGLAINAQLGIPIGVAVNASEELFISDAGNNNIRKVSTNGIINTIAGSKYGQQGYSGDGGLAVNALFNGIKGDVVFDANGNIYIPDSYNYRIRKIDNNGIVNTLVGNGIYGYNGEGILATNAEMIDPTGIALDKAGNLYISNNFRIQKVNTSNIINTIAGNGTFGFNGDNIPATSSQLGYTYCVATDAIGNIYLCDGADYRVRKIDVNGIISTIAGNGTAGNGGDGGLAISAQFSSFVSGVIADKHGNIYISDIGTERIRKIDKAGIITTIAGNGTRGFSGDGGLAIDAQFDAPAAIAMDGAGNIYVADRNNQRIRKVDANGIITTIAGDGNSGFTGDGGPAALAEINTPLALAIDTAGNILIADEGNGRIREITPEGIIKTIAGNGSTIYSGDGGPAISAGLGAEAVAVDSFGNYFIGDPANGLIRKVDANGIITTIAGGGSSYGDGSLALNAQIQNPTSINVDRFGNIFIVDFTNYRVREITNHILPLNLISFSATKEDNNVLIKWQTSNEINVSNFDVQRSTNGTTFETIGIVNAGNSKGYSYLGTNVSALNSHNVFYRLQIQDNDGKKTYSKIESVDFTVKGFDFSLYPNPAKAKVYLKGNDIKSATIFNLEGKTLIKQYFSNSDTSITVTGLPKGFYIIKVYNSKGDESSQKLLIE